MNRQVGSRAMKTMKIKTVGLALLALTACKSAETPPPDKVVTPPPKGLKKQYPKAVDTVRKLLMRDQRNVDAYKNLALVYYDQKKYKLAQTILGNAQKLAEASGKKDPDISVNLGMIQIALGDNGKAMAAFKQAVEIDPGHIVANYNIGSLELEHRDYGLAEQRHRGVGKAWPEGYSVNV